MKNKSKITIIYTIIFLFLLSTAHVCIGYPLPIYGQAIFENGNVAEGAFVNITSDRGYLTTTTDYDGYWQVDCGDPINWPIGTAINIKINVTKNGYLCLGEKNTTIDLNYVNIGTMILNSSYISNNSTDDNNNDELPENHDKKGGQETPGFSIFLILIALLIIVVSRKKIYKK